MAITRWLHTVKRWLQQCKTSRQLSSQLIGGGGMEGWFQHADVNIYPNLLHSECAFHCYKVLALGRKVVAGEENKN